MADIATIALNDLTSRVKTVSVVRRKVANLYDQDDLLDTKKKLGFPAVGIVYLGLFGKDDKSKTGLAADLIFDIYLIGGDQCTDKRGDLKPTTIGILDDMRDAIKCSRLDTIGAHRKWQFVHEAPSDFGGEMLSYVQRWKTPVLLTN